MRTDKSAMDCTCMHPPTHTHTHIPPKQRTVQNQWADGWWGPFAV